MHYAIWQACERFGILPPGVKPKWEDNDSWTQALLLAYNQVAEHDFLEMISNSSPFAVRR